MRCKKHHTDLSSSVGVCASCLRERLFVLMAAQLAQEDRRKADAPLLFPRSVSPYICRQKSSASAWNDHDHDHDHKNVKDQFFYSTPQLGPTRGGIGTGTGDLRKREKSRFSLFSRLFRSKSKETDSDPRVSDQNLPNPNSRDSCTASSSSPSWFSSMLPGRRKKQSTAGIGRRTGGHRDRGMSPARVSDYGDEGEWFDGSSGYSSETSQNWWHTPRRATAAAGTTRRGGGRPRNISGMTFFSSPLVRASPNRHWNQKGIAPEMSFSGELRVPVNLSTAASFCANRSRKLADFGRFNHNH